jgi:hypothetical protein
MAHHAIKHNSVNHRAKGISGLVFAYHVAGSVEMYIAKLQQRMRDFAI